MGLSTTLLGLFAAPPLRRRAPSPSKPLDSQQRFEQALLSMEQGRPTGAFRVMSELADDGHGPASRIALTLAQRGTALFGGRYPATAAQRARWLRHAG
jgi:hypothetical protein